MATPKMQPLEGFEALLELKALIDDMPRYAELAASLQTQIDKLNEKIEVHGQAEQIPGLLLQAKADAAAASKLLAEARIKADRIVAEAEAGLRQREVALRMSEEAVAEDRAKVSTEKKKLNEERSAFEARVKQREQEIHDFANQTQRRAAEVDAAEAKLKARADAFEEAARAARG